MYNCYEYGIRCYQDNEVGLLKFEEVDCLSAAKNTDFRKEINVFPNPAGSTIHLTSDNVKVLAVKLFSLSGNMLLSSHHESTISIHNIPEGIYYLWISTEKGIFYEKLMIDR